MLVIGGLDTECNEISVKDPLRTEAFLKEVHYG